jgi:hypothetical protein
MRDLYFIKSKKHGTLCLRYDSSLPLHRHLVEEHTWGVTRNGRTFYATTNVRNEDGTRTRKGFHTLAYPCEKGFEPNHINGNGLDNTPENIEIVSHKSNVQDRRKQEECSSKYRGVYRRARDKKWIVQIQQRINGVKKYKYLGYFDSEEEAAEAWNKAADELGFHGKRNNTKEKKYGP